MRNVIGRCLWSIKVDTHEWGHENFFRFLKQGAQFWKRSEIIPNMWRNC